MDDTMSDQAEINPRAFSKCVRCGELLRMNNRSNDGQLCGPCNEILAVEVGIAHHLDAVISLLDNLPTLLEAKYVKPEMTEQVKAHTKPLRNILHHVRYNVRRSV